MFRHSNSSLSRHEVVLQCHTCTDECPADESITTSGGIIEDVEQFCSLGTIMSRNCLIGGAIRDRVAVALVEWHDIGSLLLKRGTHL